MPTFQSIGARKLTSLGFLLMLTFVMAQDPATISAERLRIQRLVQESLKNDYEEPTPETVKQSSAESVSYLLEFGLDRNLNLAFRKRSLTYLSAIPDQRVLVPFQDYYRACMRSPEQACELSSEIDRITAIYYRKTKDTSALTFYIDMLKDAGLAAPFKLGAIRTLAQCKDESTAKLLKDLVVRNKSYPYEYHRAEATLALAEMGDEEVLDDLIRYAHYALDTTFYGESGRALSAGIGLQGLSHFARKSEEANRTLLDIAKSYASNSRPDYVYKNLLDDDILRAVAETGREEGIRFLEGVIEKGDGPARVRVAIELLGNVGDENSIRVLRKLAASQEVTAAVRQISKRQKERKSKPN